MNATLASNSLLGKHFLRVAQPEAETLSLSSEWMSSGLGEETCKGASNLNLQLPAVTDGGGGGGGRLTKWGINFQLNFPLKVLEKRERWMGAAAERRTDMKPRSRLSLSPSLSAGDCLLRN